MPDASAEAPGMARAADAAALEVATAGSEVAVPVEPATADPSVSGADSVAVTEPPPLPMPTEPGGSAIERAWFEGGAELGERVWLTRRAAYERGVWSLDGAARALLATPGVTLERAEAAVSLAPDLPAAHMEWARAVWLVGESPLSALRAVGSALLAYARHPEGALWLAGSLLALLAAGLVSGGMLSLAAASSIAWPHAAHDLGDSVSRRMPAFGRVALLGTLLVAPVALGEGLLGLAASLVAVAAIYATRRQGIALAVACVAIVAGAYPVAELAGRTLGALPGDPVARAALATSRGLVSPEDAARLAAAPEDDLFAQQGLARLARREGNLGRADALYQKLLERRPNDAVLLTNAANVRLHLGHMESAFDLYRRALEVDDSATTLFNLSQAYGRAFQVENLAQALELAQAQNGDLVAELTRLQGTQPEGFVVDLPLPLRDLLLSSLANSDGKPWAAEFRTRFAPGWMGTSAAAAAALLLLALLLGLGIGARLDASCRCVRCGRRVCPRCHEIAARADICSPCNKLFNQPELTDRVLRIARISALRERGARIERLVSGVSIAIPGMAGVLARRPLLGFWGALCFSIALGALIGREGAVPDPLVAGAAGPLAFFCVAALAGAGYALCVGAALAARGRA
ncbi:MAG: tetratricopeptide repeat protein [Deltaproteobacteria bacterium]|nr:tetratricopeptide repeat protein [Deltaproteobacteria bacterium]MBW2360389.1 tetratricopeptide repeat protein [Deltaproteobacteria bacterium]